MAMKIDHIAIAVHSLEEALRVYRDLLGLELKGVEQVPEQGVRIAFLPVGETRLELLEPLSTESPVAKFLEKRGEGIHHICFEVEDLEKTLQDLAGKGVKLIDEQPRIGAHGRKMAFVHPKSLHGVLLELYQREENLG
ncbi:MAG: methylmalonyl-CoA epimerase [Anaerolineae bacterium]|nr:methylmalonyl-CoA epimerase [Anaerolineae bacterium]MDW8103050.1 methylmalonyl-CoA epimerase [Anaerolineae bacterium]